MEVEKIKELAIENLNGWVTERNKMLVKFSSHPNIKEITQLFAIADELSDITKKVIGINHHLAPQIVATLCALMIGIMEGDISKELTKLSALFNIAQIQVNASKSVH